MVGNSRNIEQILSISFRWTVLSTCEKILMCKKPDWNLSRDVRGPYSKGEFLINNYIVWVVMTL